MCRRIAFVAYHGRMSSQFRAVLSPCTGVCTLDEDGLCRGCHRTGDEIAMWTLLDDAARLHVMDVVLPERAARREAE